MCERTVREKSLKAKSLRCNGGNWAQSHSILCFFSGRMLSHLPPVCTYVHVCFGTWLNLLEIFLALFNGSTCSPESKLVVLAYSILSLATLFSIFRTPKQSLLLTSLPSRLASQLVDGPLPQADSSWWFLMRWCLSSCWMDLLVQLLIQEFLPFLSTGWLPWTLFHLWTICSSQEVPRCSSYKGLMFPS